MHPSFITSGQQEEGVKTNKKYDTHKLSITFPVLS